MRILLCSHLFPPSVGGTETVARLLAREFVAAGHEVRVVTQTLGDSGESCAVFRKPSVSTLLRLVDWAEIVFHNHISVRTAWPLLLVHRRWFVTHQTWLNHDGGGAAGRFKRAMLRSATNISVSTAIAESLPVSSRLIPNPYDADLFYVRREIPRTRDFLFVGRLVSDKGCDLLLDAVELLRRKGLRPSVTIVGEGPERARLEKRSGANVSFMGPLQGEQLARCYNEHRVLVVPSRWKEPFGIVALEGIASGCMVAGSSGGGLAEAIGPCGCIFESGCAVALAGGLQRLLAASSQEFARHAEAHLKLHHPAVIARRYLEAFQAAE